MIGHLLDGLRPLSDMFGPARLPSVGIGKASLDTLHVKVAEVKEVELRINGEVVPFDTMKARSPYDWLSDDARLGVACR